jgi:uncharacterized protein YlzI (FlbEa/FlbD family)
MNQQSIDTTDMVIGSRSWVDAVYASGPAREVDGKARSTVRHFLTGDGVDGLDDIENLNVLEGWLEKEAAVVLKILKNWKFVSRFKAQPFQLTKEKHGVDAYPDFIVDLTDGRRFVIEVKTMRWFTEEEKTQQEAVANSFINTPIQFEIWTDKFPVGKDVLHNLNHMRRANNLGYEKEELEKVIEKISEKPKKISEILEATDGVNLDKILAAAYQGRIYLNFILPIKGDTYVHKNRNDRILEALFTPWIRNRMGWDSLPGTPLDK